MTGIIIFFHVVVCALLATIILMQAGRGGGLTEQFSSAESMFGAKTNIVLIRATTVLGSIFLVTCLSLAFISSKAGKSLVTKDLMSRKSTTNPLTSTSANSIVKDVEEKAKSEVNPATSSQPIGENANPPSPEPQAATSPATAQNPQ